MILSFDELLELVIKSALQVKQLEQVLDGAHDSVAAEAAHALRHAKTLESRRRAMLHETVRGGRAGPQANNPVIVIDDLVIHQAKDQTRHATLYTMLNRDVEINRAKEMTRYYQRLYHDAMETHNHFRKAVEEVFDKARSVTIVDHPYQGSYRAPTIDDIRKEIAVL